jgi:hypothetical protein
MRDKIGTMQNKQAGHATDVRISDEVLAVDLVDGRTLSVPLDWYPRLAHGTKAEREHWEWHGEGEGIHWPDLDEDLSVEGLLAGWPSGESERSFQRWLAAKREGRPLTLNALLEHERQERGD